MASKVLEELSENETDALKKTLCFLMKLNEMGILDTLNHLLEPEVIGGLSSLILNKGTLKLLDNVDTLLKSLGEVPKEPKEVGIFGLLGELRDPDVKRGLGFVIALLRSLGKALKSNFS